MKNRPRKAPSSRHGIVERRKTINRIFGILGPAAAVAAVLNMSTPELKESAEKLQKRREAVAQTASVSEPELTAEEQYEMEQAQEHSKGPAAEVEIEEGAYDFPKHISLETRNEAKSNINELDSLLKSEGLQEFSNIITFLYMAEEGWWRELEITEILDHIKLKNYSIASELVKQLQKMKFLREQFAEATERVELSPAQRRDVNMLIDSGNLKEAERWFENLEQDPIFQMNILLELVFKNISECKDDEIKKELTKKLLKVGALPNGNSSEIDHKAEQVGRLVDEMEEHGL